jgi:hypothetical protein
VGVNGGTYQAGSWGNIPAALQQVPPGATLCGTDIIGDGGGFEGQLTLIAGSLWDQQIYTFYSPLVAQIPGGCSLSSDEVKTQGSGILQQSGAMFNCTSGAMGAIEADSTYLFYTLAYYAP